MTMTTIIASVIALFVGIAIGWVYYEISHEIPGTKYHQRS